MQAWESLSIQLLPAVLQDFVRLIGVQATMALVDRYGGLRIYIPAKPTPDHAFAQLIGFDNLLALAKVYGREDHFTVPKAKRALEAVRNAKILSEYGPKSLRKLADEHRLHERQISRIIARAEAKNIARAEAKNDHQSKLFG